jgi:hypothetical protein
LAELVGFDNVKSALVADISPSVNDAVEAFAVSRDAP